MLSIRLPLFLPALAALVTVVGCASSPSDHEEEASGDDGLTSNPTLAAALASGRQWCGVSFELVVPSAVAHKSDFPGVPELPPGPPPISSTVVGANDFFFQGSLECGAAVGNLLKEPEAGWACTISRGLTSGVFAVETAATRDDAAKATVTACVHAAGILDPCFNENHVVCFKRS